MIHTNRCKNCGKMKDEHALTGGILDYPNQIRYCDGTGRRFVDSGLAALDAHKEELYEMLKGIVDAYKVEHAGYLIQKAIDSGEDLLNQIEKEKCSILNQTEKEK